MPSRIILLAICSGWILAAQTNSAQQKTTQQKVTIVQFVQLTTRAGDFPAAEKALQQYRAALGMTPEYLDALSWLGRGQLAHNNVGAAEKNATEVHSLAVAQLAHR